MYSQQDQIVMYKVIDSWKYYILDPRFDFNFSLPISLLLLDPPINHHLPNRLDGTLNRLNGHLQPLSAPISHVYAHKEGGKKELVAKHTFLSRSLCCSTSGESSWISGKLNSNVYVIFKSSSPPDGPSEMILRMCVPLACSKSTCAAPRQP